MSGLTTARLRVDLTALVANWRLMNSLSGRTCAGVVKADAYGLGACKVAPALSAAGCREFFVAMAEEAASLRKILPSGAIVYVLSGPLTAADASFFTEHNITPVLNSLKQAALWREKGGGTPAALHVDTGMNRLGLTAVEWERVRENPEILGGLNIQLIMSHLASADEPQSPQNAAQLQKFTEIRDTFPDARASFANSAGAALAGDYVFDLPRPGIAVYGGRPVPLLEKIKPVARVEVPILQVREIQKGETVGYNATYTAPKPRRIATVAAGYADGYLRSQSNRATALVAGVEVPVVGRVSMDLITLDVSEVPPGKILPGTLVTLLGGGLDLDAQAMAAGTISYELLTSLGRRYRRVYTEQN